MNCRGSRKRKFPPTQNSQRIMRITFFNGSHPEKGRCYVIVCTNNGKEEDIGIISYTSFHLRDKITEFDIWLKGNHYTGHGFGTKAIQILTSIVKGLGYEKKSLSVLQNTINGPLNPTKRRDL
nr:GNAT family N-acetyltransferase [Methanobacterium formicicum]